MPEIAGLALLDASGNALTDASAAYLKEPNISVLVDASGVLMAAIPIPPGLLQLIADAVVAAIADALLGGSGTVDLKALESQIAAAKTSADNAYTAASNAETAADDVGTAVAAHDANLNSVASTIAGNFAVVLPTIADIEEKIDALGDGGGLTSEEHDKLIGLPGGDEIAGDVWGYNFPMSYLDGVEWGPMAGTVLQAVGDYLQLEQGFYGRPIAGNDFFRLCFLDIERGNAWVGNWADEDITTIVPELNLADVQYGERVMGFLQRTLPAYSWTQVAPGGQTTDGTVWLVLQAGVSYARCTLTDADLQALWPVSTETVEVTTEVVEVTTQEVEVIQQTVELNTAPVWPGVANVTLGTPVALSNMLRVAAPMDGVIIAVTTPPQKLGRYQIGTQTYDYGVGRVAFESDRGELETWQYLGFRAGIFTPKAMKRAVAVHLQVLGGAEGTVTPWTVS